MSNSKKKRPDHPIDLLKTIREKIERGQYRFTNHAMDRQKQRDVHFRDVLHVLKNGWHEERKTTLDLATQLWKYAIRGKIIDGTTDLRVVIAIEDDVVVITVIRLTEGKG